MGSAIVVALAAGSLVAVQVMLLGRASGTHHPLAVSLALQVSGLAAGVVWATWHRAWSSAISVAGFWWWIPLGATGWGLVAALGFASARIGVASTLVTVVASQLVVGLAIDAVAGNVDIGIRQHLGVVLLVSGAILVAMR